VVGTPIGNLDDLSPRAAAALAAADLIAAEDTRRTRILLGRIGASPRLVSFHAHNQRARLEPLLRILREGKTVALVTDAGTPGISDPGHLLVRAALEEGFPVTPVPGPSAVATALSASGFPADTFVFEGFLPHKKGRRTRLAALADEPRTVVLYESSHRIRRLLEELAALCPAREVGVAREITKLHEEMVRGTVGEVRDLLSGREPRGEYTLVLGPLPRQTRRGDEPDGG
jgi:16S rRNA (cytidine1402-2'-O)-methyltransferase